MNRNVAIFTRWALAGALVGLGLVGLNRAIGQSTPLGGGPTVQVAGLNLQGRFDTDSLPKLRLEVTVKNPTRREVSLDQKVSLVKLQFKGNPLSRTVTPGDRVMTEVETASLRGTIQPGESRKIMVPFRSVLKTEGMGNYQATIRTGGNVRTILGSVPMGLKPVARK